VYQTLWSDCGLSSSPPTTISGVASASEHCKLVERVHNRNTDKAPALILRHMQRARNYWDVPLGDKTTRAVRGDK